VLVRAREATPLKENREKSQGHGRIRARLPAEGEKGKKRRQKSVNNKKKKKMQQLLFLSSGYRKCYAPKQRATDAVDGDIELWDASVSVSASGWCATICFLPRRQSQKSVRACVPRRRQYLHGDNEN
jgi:hypothetical protein